MKNQFAFTLLILLGCVQFAHAQSADSKPMSPADVVEFVDTHNSAQPRNQNQLKRSALTPGANGLTKKRGTYFTSPSDCDIQKPPLTGAVKINRPSVTIGSNKSSEDGMEEYPINPFSKLVLNHNSRFNIYIVPGARAQLFVPRMSQIARNAREHEVKQDGDTLTLSSYSSRFKLITPKLDQVRLVENGTAKIKGLNGGKINIIIDSNGTVWASGKVDSANIDVLQNGTAALNNLEAKNEVCMVRENGSAHVNATEYLSASVLSNGGIYYTKLPPRVDKDVRWAGGNSFVPISQAPEYRQERLEPEE